MSEPGHAPVVRLAPAKLNLTLSVGPRRPDGYHDLHSIMVPLGIADRLSVARGHGPADTLHVVGDDGARAAAPDDLVLKALAAARRAVGRAADAFSLAVRLEKRIPVAAGLGGGSSDAAAAIGAALEAWGAADALPPAERVEVAMSIGSDVPFFLVGGPALVEGRGDRLTPLRRPLGEPVGVLVMTPAVGVSTPEAFRRLDAGGEAAATDRRSTRLTSEHLAAELRAGLRGSDLVARAGVLATANDLVPAAAAIVPELRAFRRTVARLLRRPVGQSGSGPTLWALYPSLGEAEAAAGELERRSASGELEAPGERPPRITATTIVGPDTGRIEA
jgi:4-diphosphocytidyl-2-C-methyl-D-erythritol kinase